MLTNAEFERPLPPLALLLASSNGRSSNASKGTTNRPLELSVGEHRPDRVVNCNDREHKTPKLVVRVEIVRYLLEVA